jgi:hypothetical protein
MNGKCRCLSAVSDSVTRFRLPVRHEYEDDRFWSFGMQRHKRGFKEASHVTSDRLRGSFSGNCCRGQSL